MRDALAAWGARRDGGDPALRPVAPAALHLTLAFLGVRAPADVGPIAGGGGARGRGAARGRRRWGSGSALWLAPRRPHVLTVAVEDPDGALARCRSASSPSWPARSWAGSPSAGRFRAARDRGPGAARPRAARLRRAGAAASGRVRARPRWRVMRSELGAGGARYERADDGRAGRRRHAPS